MADVALEIRKYRKKLRQIENLERQHRDLTEEEEAKVSRKDAIRANLQKLLAEQELQNDLRNMASVEESPSEHVNPEQPEIHEDSQDTTEGGDPGDQNAQPSGPGTESGQETRGVTQTNPQTDTPAVHVPPEGAGREVAREKVVSTSRTDMDASGTRLHRTSLPAAKLHSSLFSVRTLEGHNDLICAVDCRDSVLVSASRDTMLKLWDADSGRELRSMGGHTGTVTSVVLVPGLEEATGPVSGRVGRSLAITGSQDCSIKIWSLSDGQLKRSIYAYSPVAGVDQHSGRIASGSESGKVELWNLETGQSVTSVQGHEEAITSVKLRGDRLVSGCAGGIVKVWDVRDQSLRPIISSDNAANSAQVAVKPRRIRCLATTEDAVYWGDDGVNVKVLDVRSGNAHKLANHVTDFGSSSAMATTGSLLVCAGYDIDRGSGFLNVRSLPQEEYLATLDDDSTSYITCLSCAECTRDGVTLQRWCTAGAELKVWDQLPSSKVKKRPRPTTDDGRVTTAKQLRRYTSPDPVDTDSSEEESEYDPTNDDSDDDDDPNTADNVRRSWCTIS